MIVDFLVWLIEVAVIYVIPLAASLRVLKDASTDDLVQKRWLIHWVLVVVANFTLYPVVSYLPGILEVVIRLGFAFGLLFINKILGTKIHDLNSQFIGASSSLVDTLRELIKGQLIKYDLVKTQSQ